MKKLLLLGGSRYILPVIEAAHKLGYWVITCDYLPDNIAHKYSDEYHDVSIVDKNAVLELAEKLKIDGIMSFACDPGVVTAAYVAEKMGLPHSGSYESVSILQNKGKFRKFLADNGFNVPMAKGYTKIEDALSETEIFNWPVIVKPTDSAGSKGVTRVDNPCELKKSIEYALSFSLGKEFIIEDFIEKKGFSSDTDSFSVDGELKFVSFSSQRFDEKADNPYTPAAYSWPSSISEENQRILTSEIQRLLKLLNMKTSIYNIETREATNGKPYIMELSPRGGGNRLAECLRYATGVDLITNAVRAAVGDDVADIEQKPYKGYWAEIILHSEKEGVFDHLWVSDDIKENLVETDLWIKCGDAVNGFSAANEAIGTVIARFDQKEDMEKFINNSNDYVKVILKQEKTMKFQGKKLLVLGGKSVGSVELVKYAKSQGAYVIVTDYLPAETSPAKKLADQCEMISTTDIDALVDFAKKENIDGVFCGVSEINLKSVRAVATQLNLPCYFTEEQWDLCQNKRIFKELCKKHNVPVAQEYNIGDMDDEKLENLDYPVIVKPVDQGAAVGISICHNKEELKKGYAFAVEKSYTKKALVEQYIVGEEFSAAYTIIDGEYRLSTIGTKYLNRSQEDMLPLPDAYVYPSKMLDVYNEKINQSVIEMFKSIGLENGTVFVQGVTDGKNIALFEAGLRMGGTALFRFVHRINGINILHLLVNFALTGNMDGNVDLEDVTLKGKKCCLLSLLNGGGKIGKIVGVEQASKVQGVVETIVRYNEGDTIPRSGTLHQSHIRFFVVRETFDDLKESIEEIQKLVKVYDENGKEMLLPGFDAKKLIK